MELITTLEGFAMDFGCRAVGGNDGDYFAFDGKHLELRPYRYGPRCQKPVVRSAGSERREEVQREECHEGG